MNIDQNGTGGRWRVWWVGADGLTREMVFRSRSAAEEWAGWSAAMEGLSDKEWAATAG